MPLQDTPRGALILNNPKNEEMFRSSNLAKRPKKACWLSGEALEGVFIGRAGDAAFGDDGGDQTGWGDVKGGVCGGNVGGDARAVDVSDFRRGTLLDGDFFAGRDGEIQSGYGRSDKNGT